MGATEGRHGTPQKGPYSRFGVKVLGLEAIEGRGSLRLIRFGGCMLGGFDVSVYQASRRGVVDWSSAWDTSQTMYNNLRVMTEQ